MIIVIREDNSSIAVFKGQERINFLSCTDTPRYISAEIQYHNGFGPQLVLTSVHFELACS